MIKKELIIKNKTGLHARPAALLVKTTGKFKSEIFISKDGYKVNGKSIMGVMMLAAEPGSEVLIQIDGADEKQAIEELKELFEKKFYEE